MHRGVDHVRPTWEVMAEVARRHPDVELMLCASGGGRTDHGTLRWFHEFWTSDNTDPVDRVRMQWRAALTSRRRCGRPRDPLGQRPVAFACAVALRGRFGFDLAPSPARRGARPVPPARAGRRTRELVQQGDLVRLVSPVEGASAAVVSSPPTRRAVVFGYRLPTPDGVTGARRSDPASTSPDSTRNGATR